MTQHTQGPWFVGMERWLPISGYEGLYEVSDLGRVRSLVMRTKAWTRSRTFPYIMALSAANNGYVGVTLTSEDSATKRLSVHRLVLMAFVGPPRPGMEGSHLDGVKTNNALTNLQWKTRSDNHADKLIHGTAQRGEACGKSKLTWEEVEDIRLRYVRRSLIDGSGALAREYGVSGFAILSIIRRKTWNPVVLKDAS